MTARAYIIAIVLLALPAMAQTAPPVVVPYKPISAPNPLGILPTDPQNTIACFAYDIGEDGHVSNVVIYQSTGSRNLDDRITAWWEKRLFQPATINGVPKKARTMGSFVVGETTKKCSEDPAMLGLTK